MARIYKKKFQEDSAIYYFNKAIEFDNLYVKKSAYCFLSKIEYNKGHYETALDYAYKSEELADSIKETTKTEAVSKIHSLYNYRHTEKENQKLQYDNERKIIHIYQLVLLLLFIVLIAICIIVYFRRKETLATEREKRLHQLKDEQYSYSLELIESNKKKIKELESLLLNTENQKDTLARQLVRAQKELLEISNNKIIAAKSEKDLLELSFKKSEIYLYFHEVQNNSNFKITESEWTKLRQAIDCTYNNFTSQLIALYPQISQHELHICYLIKIKVQVGNIAILVGRSTSAITATRIRLYKKIHGVEGSAEQMDKIINDL